MALYRCTACTATFPVNHALGCPTCGATTPMERAVESKPGKSGASKAPTLAARTAGAVAGRLTLIGDVPAGERDRIVSGIAEWDRATGGGVVRGSIIIVAGEPGMGKSTLLLQLVAAIVARDKRVAYITGEESAGQLRLRAERLGLDLATLPVAAETDASVIAATIMEAKPDIVVIDSIQVIGSPTSDAAPGSPAQIREVTHTLLRTAKETGTTIIVVGHVTKDAAVAGPKTLEHIVDAVFLIEGERSGSFRVLRAVKNRFGATDEIGLFEMRDTGLIGVEPPTPTAPEGGEAFGRVVCPVFEGSRPILVEVSAIVATAAYGSPRRIAAGVPDKRVALLLAVMERYAGIDLSGHDVYVSVGSGIRVDEPAIDAAIVAAIASSARGIAIDPGIAVAGEVRLGGGLVPIRSLATRAREATRAGFRTVVAPKTPDAPNNVQSVTDLRGLIAACGVGDGPLAVSARKAVPSWVMARRGTEEEA
jgi:DNA repair protein RadA/Sms